MHGGGVEGGVQPSGHDCTVVEGHPPHGCGIKQARHDCVGGIVGNVCGGSVGKV